MKIFFNDTHKKYSLEKITISPPNGQQSLFENNVDNSFFPEKNEKLSEVEELQGQVLNSLNYVSNHHMLPSTLPDELNVKFLNVSTWDKLKDKLTDSPIAQLQDPNTMYVSTKLLPQYQASSNNSFISNLYQRFHNPQQVLDLVVFHELGHLVFNHSFTEFNQLNQQLLSKKSMFSQFRDKFISENHDKIPLYQMNRSLEEHFADSYSAMVLFERYGVKPEDFIHMRNGKDHDGRIVTKGFDINIYRLHDSFKDVDKIDYKKEGIDSAIQKLYDLSLNGAKGIMKHKIRYIARDDKIINGLHNNLSDLGITIEPKTSSREQEINILNKAEELLKDKNSFASLQDKLNLLEKQHQSTQTKSFKQNKNQ